MCDDIVLEKLVQLFYVCAVKSNKKILAASRLKHSYLL
jgi:hypothetical protein